MSSYELSGAEWNSIQLVSEWLKAFRDATSQMSATKQLMVSSSHAIFCGLQEHIRWILRALPDDVDSTLKKALTDAHRKLSDYFYKFDQSEYYTWAVRECFFLLPP
jgi:hypothetical protein